MKDKKFKAFIAILLVITIISSIFAINVFADDRITYGHAIDYLYDQWQKMDAGHQTYQDFYDNCRNMQKNLEPNPLSHVAYGSLYSTIYAAYSTWDGMTDISSKIKALFDDFMDKNKNTTDTPLEDMKGFGAMAKFTYSVMGTPGYIAYIYCEYIILDKSDGSFVCFGNIIQKDFLPNGSDRNAKANLYKNIYNEQFVDMYGDIRYIDGSSENIPVPTETGTTSNLDNMTDNEVAELIQQLIDKINALKPEPPPDLSSVEGILQAIYNQLTDMNTKLDNMEPGESCHCITVEDLNAAILQLLNKDKSPEILEVLLEMREIMKKEQNDSGETGETGGTGGTGGDTETGESKLILGTLYNVIPLEKTFWNSLFNGNRPRVFWNGSEFNLETDGTLYLEKKLYDTNTWFSQYKEGYYYCDFNYNPTQSEINFLIENDFIKIDENYFDVYYIDDSVDIELESIKLTSYEKKLANTFLNFIQFLKGAGQYQVVNTFCSSLTALIFFDYTPTDIKFTFDLSIPGSTESNESKGTEYTLISANILTENADSIKTIKSFSSILLLFGWAFNMRKRIAN